MNIIFDLILHVILYASIIYIFHLLYEYLKEILLINNITYVKNENVEKAIETSIEKEDKLKTLENDLNIFVTNNFETKIDKK